MYDRDLGRSLILISPVKRSLLGDILIDRLDVSCDGTLV